MEQIGIFYIPCYALLNSDKMKYVECRDKFSNEVKEGDFVDVQTDGVYQVYKKEDGQLYFKPYGREDRVSAYFSNDMVLCTKDGQVLLN